jgi:uncharacterized protein YndB with AHSA1/START domain
VPAAHIDRRLAVPAQRFLCAFTVPAAKALWLRGTPVKRTEIERVMDLRVGDRDLASGQWTKWTHRPVRTFDTVFHDIVPDQRIIYRSNMFVEARKLSVCLAIIEIRAAGPGRDPSAGLRTGLLPGWLR